MHKRSRRSKQGELEALEKRIQFAVFTVTSAADSGVGSLRDALTQANSLVGADTIRFSIGSGAVTIPVATILPKQLEAVTVDGTTQPGFSGTPLITLDGGNQPFNGLHLSGGSSTVRALTIQRFGFNGIEMDLAGSDVVEGCRVIANGQDGINVNSPSNRIGGTALNQGNVISGNGDDGVDIGGESSGNTIVGNLIGLNPAGTAAQANTSYGLRIVNSNNNVVGGLTASARNVISGNKREGVRLSGTSSGNVFQGNYVGLNASGTAAIANDIGFTIFGSNNLIGGTQAGARNIISGNTGDGVRLSSLTAIGNRIEGNYIGTNPAGTAAIGNGELGVGGTAGVHAISSTGNFIGGSDAGTGNLISGNLNEGNRIDGLGADATFVRGNVVGLNAAGTAAIPNVSDGMQIIIGSHTIGGTLPAERNVFSGNGDDGIELQTSGAVASLIIGNYFGTNVAGNSAVPNASDGVEIQGAMNTIIGGTTAAERNIFAGNTSDGIEVNMNIPGVDGQGTQIRGNWIGLNAAGSPLGNVGHGVHLKCGGLTVIGGSIAAANVIANNGADGIYVVTSSGNHFSHNSIYNNGGLGIDIALDGINPNDALDADIGPNGLQNFPVIASATATAVATTIAIALNSSPSSTYTIDLYTNSVADPSGSGEGETWRGQTTLTTDANGDGTATLILPVGLSGSILSAVATDSAGSSSEFSVNAVVVPATAAPSVTSFVFDDSPAVGSASPNTLIYTWSEAIDPASIQPGDFVIQNQTTGGVISSTAISAVAGAANELRVTFPGLSDGILPDGRYLVTLPAGSIANLGGNSNTSADARPFNFMLGDADHSLAVDFADLLIVAQNYGSSGRTFSQGNFDYDPIGKVDFSDLLIIAQRYGSSILASPGTAKASSAARKNTRLIEI